jgi:hypothetical protein
VPARFEVALRSGRGNPNAYRTKGQRLFTK